jgi:lipopolysaccharide export system protein LptA
MTLPRIVGCMAALLLVAGPVRGQVGPPPSGRCRFVLDNVPGNHLSVIKLPSGQYNSYIGGGVIARCPAQRLVLRSDSLEAYGDEDRYYFIGHVDYVEPRLTLKSDFLTYFQPEERLLAASNVDAQLPSGSNLKGPQLEFWRAIPRVREQHATAVGRPTISIVEKDSIGRPRPPVTVTGNNVWMAGDSVVASSGQVVVIRPELTASGDSLYLDAGTGLLRLMRGPRVLGSKGRPYTLVGETIDVLTKQRKLDRVLAKSKAEATSQDVNLKSDTIDLRIVNDSLHRAISWGKSRSRALSASQSIISDSTDVLMPGQRLREMHAVGDAVAEGAPDSTRFRTTERDRLTGDTIVAHFDTAASLLRDTTSKPKIRLLVSNGHATSLQHLPPRDTTLRTPAIVYVVGRAINVSFDSGAVKQVTVRDDSLATGLYLEPEKADTSAAGRRAAAARRDAATAGGAGPAAAAARAAGDTRRAPATPAPSPSPATARPSTVPARRP